MMLFYTGTALDELDLMRAGGPPPSPPLPLLGPAVAAAGPREKINKACAVVIVAVLYLMSQTDVGADKTPGGWCSRARSRCVAARRSAPVLAVRGRGAVRAAIARSPGWRHTGTAPRWRRCSSCSSSCGWWTSSGGPSMRPSCGSPDGRIAYVLSRTSSLCPSDKYIAKLYVGHLTHTTKSTYHQKMGSDTPLSLQLSCYQDRPGTRPKYHTRIIISLWFFFVALITPAAVCYPSCRWACSAPPGFR